MFAEGQKFYTRGGVKINKKINLNKMKLQKSDIKLNKEFWNFVEIELKNSLSMLEIQKIREFFPYLEKKRKDNPRVRKDNGYPIFRLELLAEDQFIKKRVSRMVELFLLLNKYTLKRYENEQEKIIKKITFFYYFYY